MSPEEMLKEADRLTTQQRAIRGSERIAGLDGKPSSRPGPYIASPESEQRASQILQLRRAAAREIYPIRREAAVSV